MRLGERLFIELLNVPVTAEPSRYTVRVTLADETGRTVRAFDAHEFAAEALEEHRLEVASETLASQRVLQPRLDIQTAQGRTIAIHEGLFPIRVRPTWNWNYTSVRQPIRDLARLRRCASRCRGD